MLALCVRVSIQEKQNLKVTSVKAGAVERTCFCCHLVCYQVTGGICAKLESILILQQSLTEHYFLCKDTTCTYILCRKKTKKQNTSGNRKIFF